MKVGVQVRATAEGVDLRWIAKEIEARGFESIFLPEHTHVPVQGTSIHPGGDDLMEAARRGFDPLIGLAIIAASTEHLHIGTGVLLLPQHDPIVLAKQISTLDQLSGGRVILGVGAGWAREEMANHGVDPARRWAVLRETAIAIRTIWTEDEASYQGEFVRFDPIWQWPKPLQRPHPPILLGGEGPRALQRVVEYGDGWIPNWEPNTLERIQELDRLSREAGRGRLPVTLYSVPKERAVVRECIEAGVERIVFDVPSDDRVKTARKLDRIAELTR